MQSLSKIWVVISTLVLISCATPAPENIYPFDYIDDKGYGITAPVEGNIYEDFYDFFESRGYTGNGPTWRGIIENIIKDEAPHLQSFIEYDEEAGGFYMYMDSKSIRNQVLNVIVPYFSDKQKLSDYMTTIDRDTVDD